MRRVLYLGILLSSVLSMGWAEKLVYVIPLRDEVEQSMVYLARRGVKEAIEKKADALVLHMNTNGGRADCMEEIVEAVGKFPHQDQTYTYIDAKAISAGAFIASGTRYIYMAPGSVIGAATPVMISSGGGGVEKLPESYEKKINSAFQAIARASAEKNGHNPKVFDAMVDRESGLEIDGVEVLAKGKVLTLTNGEAEKTYGKPPKPLLSSGTVKDLETLINKIGGDGAKTAQLEPTGFEQVARLFTMVSPLLLTIGLVLGYIEFKTPGFGIFGILAGVCFVVFFFGHYVAGLSGYEPIIIFLLGVGLIALEAFLFPGLLLPTLVGLCLVVGALIFSMVDRYPTDSIWPSMQQLNQPLTNLAAAVAMAVVGAFLVARFIPQRWVSAGLEEATINGAAFLPTQTPAVGAEGIALNALHPSGSAVINGVTFDVVSDGRLLPKGARVKVIAAEGYRIVVAPIA